MIFLYIGKAPHNHPLYMIGHVIETRINKIIIDEGSGVKKLTEELVEIFLIIQGRKGAYVLSYRRLISKFFDVCDQ